MQNQPHDFLQATELLFCKIILMYGRGYRIVWPWWGFIATPWLQFPVLA